MYLTFNQYVYEEANLEVMVLICLRFAEALISQCVKCGIVYKRGSENGM
jgi:hypothetical protein